MYKNKINQTLHWVWQGIQVWNTIVSLGIPAMIRGIFHNIFDGWQWYNQLLLFGGAFLVILGLLAFLVGKRQSHKESNVIGVVPSVTLIKEQQDLLDFYEQQRAIWEQYIILDIANVICYTKAKTPYLIFKLLVRNFHPVTFKIVKLKADGTLSYLGQIGNLPSIKDDEERNFGRCSEGQFNLKVDINGTGLPVMLEAAAEKMESVQWIIQGQWSIEIYGKIRLLRHPPDLNFSKIPQLMASN